MASSILHQQPAAGDNSEWMLQFSFTILVVSAQH